MRLINWYPGHIAKAQRELKTNLKLVDLVIEMVDARLPITSHFPFLDEILQNKQKILVMNKADLADPIKMDAAVDYWKNKDVEAIQMSTLDHKDVIKLKTVLKKYHTALSAKLAKKGVLPRSLRVMVIGIPNIGKSTLINRIVEKKKTRTGDKPGVTKTTQWIRIGDNIDLLDTPGIIIPKFEDQMLAVKLVMIGSISTEAYEPLETSREVIKYLSERSMIIPQFGDDFSVEKYGQIRNFIMAGGQIDVERACKTFIKDLRDGRLGNFSLE